MRAPAGHGRGGRLCHPEVIQPRLTCAALTPQEPSLTPPLPICRRQPAGQGGRGRHPPALPAGDWLPGGRAQWRHSTPPNLHVSGGATGCTRGGSDDGRAWRGLPVCAREQQTFKQLAVWSSRTWPAMPGNPTSPVGGRAHAGNLSGNGCRSTAAVGMQPCAPLRPCQHATCPAHPDGFSRPELFSLSPPGQHGGGGRV